MVSYINNIYIRTAARHCAIETVKKKMKKNEKKSTAFVMSAAACSSFAIYRIIIIIAVIIIYGRSACVYYIHIYRIRVARVMLQQKR